MAAKIGHRSGLLPLAQRFTAHQLDEREWRIGRRRNDADRRQQVGASRIARLSEAFRRGRIAHHDRIQKAMRINLDRIRSVQARDQGARRLQLRAASMLNRMFGAFMSRRGQ